MKNKFAFNADLLPSENIGAFIKHLETIDAELAAILEKHINIMLPVSEQSHDKGVARKEFNKNVLSDIRKLKITPEGTV